MCSKFLPGWKVHLPVLPSSNTHLLFSLMSPHFIMYANKRHGQQLFLSLKKGFWNDPDWHLSVVAPGTCQNRSKRWRRTFMSEQRTPNSCWASRGARSPCNSTRYWSPDRKISHLLSHVNHISMDDSYTSLSPLLQLLLCSLYEIYLALEEEMDRNCDHPSIAPIYFPAELARLAAIEEDLEFFLGQDWRKKIVVPAATKRYCHRIRQVLFIALSFFFCCLSQNNNIVNPFSDWEGEPRIPDGPCLHPVPGWPVWRAGAGSDRPEIDEAEQQRWPVLLRFSRCLQPQPIQTAVPQQDEQRWADGGAEEQGARRGIQSLRAQHSGMDGS